MSAPSPTYKPSVTPPVFIPKETNAPLPDINTSIYSSPQGATSYNATSTHYNDEQNFAPSQPQPPTTPRLNYNSLQNYNTAPRGWGANQDAYKPLSFTKQKSKFSDF